MVLIYHTRKPSIFEHFEIHQYVSSPKFRSDSALTVIRKRGRKIGLHWSNLPPALRLHLFLALMSWFYPASEEKTKVKFPLLDGLHRGSALRPRDSDNRFAGGLRCRTRNSHRNCVNFNQHLQELYIYLNQVDNFREKILRSIYIIGI